MKCIEESRFCVLRKKTPDSKGVIFMRGWISEIDLNKYGRLIQELKKNYYIIGLTSGSEVIKSIHFTRPDDMIFDLYAAPNAAYSQSVMADSMVASKAGVAKTFIFHQTMAKSMPPSRICNEKIYDAIIVMNLNVVKMWGVFCDLAKMLPDYKFLAVMGSSSFNGSWLRAKKNYKHRISRLSNVSYLDCVNHRDLLSFMSESKCLIHICDYDPGPMVVGEAMSVDTPVMINVNCSSASRSLIRPTTGMFFKLHEIKDKFLLMMDLIKSDIFQTRQTYLHRWGYKNSLDFIKKNIEFYGLGNTDSVSFPNKEDTDVNSWYSFPGFRVTGLGNGE